MMASSEPSCAVCEFQHVLKSASTWCSDCDEGLCIDCSKHHGISKATRKHVTIPISEYKTLPTYITNIKQTCSTHDEKYLIYCNEHECACCSKCIVERHTKCQNISNLDDVVKNTKTSNAFLEIHESVNEVAENIKRIRQDKNNNLKTLSEQRKQIERDVQQVRLNINRHLDKLQEDFILELYEIEKRENKKINQLMKALDEHESKVAEHQKNIANIKQHASDLQTFLALKQIESDVDKNCQFIDSITESNVLNRVEIKFNINTSLSDITNSVFEFGKVSIDNSNSSVNIVKKKQQQAQLILPKVSPIMPIENIQVKLEQTIKTESSYVRGCCILPDSRFVFAYPEFDKVTVVKQDGTVDFSLNVTAASGIAYNNKDNTIAISSCWGSRGKQITIIDLFKRKVKKTFSPGGQTDGIAVTNNNCLYHLKNKAVRAMDLTDESIRDITTENMDTEINITISGHKLYYSSYKYHTVVCCDMQGAKQWTFKNEIVLKNPLGISTDNAGNVYVVGFQSNNVVVISPDGQTHRELLTERDGLDSPWSINFRKETNQLLVEISMRMRFCITYLVIKPLQYYILMQY
ncbi:unnamed protein product [Mytilus edulis]|uniref:B box-type domain-containing protein n=1 Tax=Mytilus edulis TaxID=6550 RepID=A0A8S3TGQ4_MYTED|nr:unnamed protein product [Mytilus edulis]